MTISERNALVEQYLPLVKSVVGKIAANGIPTYIELDDLIQEASMRLVDAVRQYRGRNGACMITFLQRTIRNDVMDAIRSEQGSRNGSHEYSLSQLQRDNRRVDMRDAKKILTPRQWDAMLYVYGLGFTQSETARIMRCSQQTISYFISRACKKLQIPPM